MPEIVAHGIRIKDPGALFGEYRVSSFDLARYERLISEGHYEEAIDDFVQTYIVDFADLLNSSLVDYMSQASTGQIPERDFSRMILSVSVLALATKNVMTENFNSFMTILGRQVFSAQGIRSEQVQAMILQSTLQQFEELTSGAMSQTANNILTQIRLMQRAMIIENQKIASLDIVGKLLVDEVSSFKNGLSVKFPEYFDAMEKGNILKSRAFGPDGLRVVRYKLGDYAEMATHTTLLNVDRTAVEVSAGVNGDKIVQFYLRDHRKLKTGPERESCKQVLNSGGLLALDQETADAMGIWTLDQARAEGCMGPHCRHSIKTVRAKQEAAA